MGSEYNYLNKINSPSDIKSLSFHQLNLLAHEIRSYLIEVVSNNGGHLAPNLGSVELTIAMHKVFDLPNDKIVFDVGHQAYVHKILTGRKENFKSIRTFEGISGFPSPKESEFDAFIAGHASTSISAAYGIACANKINNVKSNVVALIGDGALTGGLAFEALNNAGHAGKDDKIIVVLNDNEMSISENVGAFSNYLSQIRLKKEYFEFKDRTESVLNKIPFIGKSTVKCMKKAKNFVKDLVVHSDFFSDMGYEYLGPVDGHNIKALCTLFERAINLDTSVVIHAVTKKGKGYIPAEKNPSIFHGISSFDKNTGNTNKAKVIDFSHKAGDILCEKASNDNRICTITAAMRDGTGLTQFSKQYPDRFFDVGIAEEHAVTFTSGLAKSGAKPCFAVYSTFLQRGYDQLIHDAALCSLPAIFLVDRAGIVGEDGETHQGIFDVAFLTSIPNMKLFAPANYSQLEKNINYALDNSDSPCAIRYHRGKEISQINGFELLDEDYTYIQKSNTKNNIIITYGRIYKNCVNAIKKNMNDGIEYDIIYLNSLKPIPQNIYKILAMYKNVVIVEEAIKCGGIAMQITAQIAEKGLNIKTTIKAIEDMFVTHGSVEKLFELLGFDEISLAKLFKEKSI